MHYLHVCKHWEDLCARGFCLPSAQPVYATHAQQDIPEHSFAVSAEAVNVIMFLINSLLKIMHMSLLISLRMCPQFCLPG